MPYALTVSRNGMVIDTPDFGSAKPVPDSNLERKFEQHAAHMHGSRAFGSIDAALMDAVHSEDRHARWMYLPQAASAATTEPLRKTGIMAATSFMARFPTRKLECTLGDMTWLVRAFAVATSHALQEGAGSTRLWWNFEACPKDTTQRPNRNDALRFLDMADRMEEEAMPLLRCAYERALEEVAGISGFSRHGSCIRVSLTDADTRSATALEGWLNIVHQTGQESTRRSAMPADAQRGVDVLNSYVSRALHIPVAPAYPITLLRETPGMTGIVVRHENEAEGVMVTGLVTREKAHMLNQHGETNMRRVSGALVLSELVARREGRNFGVKFPALEPTH